MTDATPGAIWKLHERLVRIRDLAIKYCLRVEQVGMNAHDLQRVRDRPFDPEFDDSNDLESLSDACLDILGHADADTWCTLGEASKHTGNPLTISLHAQIVGWCRHLLSAIRDPDLLFCQVGTDGLTNEDQESLEQAALAELSGIAGGHRRQFEAIGLNKLRAEASNACQLRETRQQSDNTGDGREESAGTANPARKAATCNQLMMEMIQKNSTECVGWSARQWSVRLNKSKSTVIGTKAWESIQTLRAAEMFRRTEP